jgi:hypothetical protein
MHGVEERDTATGIHVVRLHYSADPVKREPEWQKEARRGLSDRSWRKEYEIDWTIASGLPVYADEFQRDLHIAKEPLLTLQGLPILRGWDFGLQPACVWAQVDKQGRMNVLHELVTWNGRGEVKQQGIENFAPLVIVESNRLFPKCVFLDYCDPAGWQRAQSDEKSCVDIMNSLSIYPDRGTVSFIARRSAMRDKLTRMVGCRPTLMLDAKCTMLIEGFEGAYKYRQIGETERYIEEPVKNAWSHIMDGLSYLTGEMYIPDVDSKMEPEDKPLTWQEKIESDENRAGLFY